MNEHAASSGYPLRVEGELMPPEPLVVVGQVRFW
jgi:hypothetical protein